LLYSYLAQDELGSSVFGHRDPFKNVKRKYVFELTYGFYDLKTAETQERLRDVQVLLRDIRSRQKLFDTFFEGTPLGNRINIERELQEVNEALQDVESTALELASEPQSAGHTALLQAEILELEKESANLQAAIDAEQQSLSNLRDLANQLEAQSGKLTRSIVSHKHLFDIEFVVCPRCGTQLSEDRSSAHLCTLCHQEPSLELSREPLIAQQGVVEQQLTEIQDLFGERADRSALLQEQLEDTRRRLKEMRLELDFQTKSYISEQATTIAATAARRARLTARSSQLQEHLNILSRMDEAQEIAASLEAEEGVLKQYLATTMAESRENQSNVNRLRERFNHILEQLRPPKFGEQESSDIDPNSYLPVYRGRPLAEISSPGLATLINISHALAHHLTAIELKLRLPQILIIDGLSEHLGQEGLDPERLTATYDLLIQTSNEHPELQVIVVDNEIPESARAYIRLELSEEDRLIRESIE